MTIKPAILGAAVARPKLKNQSTRQTLRRLKELLQNRLSQFESQIEEIGVEISSLANERDIRATNTLVRTLEKVLDLEHKDRKQRSTQARKNRKLDDAEREELARRIANLPPERHGKNRKSNVENARSARLKSNLDQLGEVEPASA
jgi:hypothetical protein